jgi:hypothetical protein
MSFRNASKLTGISLKGRHRGAQQFRWMALSLRQPLTVALLPMLGFRSRTNGVSMQTKSLSRATASPEPIKSRIYRNIQRDSLKMDVL